VQGQVARFSSPLVVTLTRSLAAIVSLPAGWLTQVAIVYFGALIAGGDVEFGWIFATAPWLGIRFVLETILQTIYVSTQGKLLVNHGLSYLVSTGKPLADARNASYVALRQASLFRLWNLLLVNVLLRSVGKLGRSSAFLVPVIYLSLLVGGQVVAQLDTADLDLAVRQAQISLRTAQAQLQQLQDGPSVSDLADCPGKRAGQLPATPVGNRRRPVGGGRRAGRTGSGAGATCPGGLRQSEGHAQRRHVSPVHSVAASHHHL
jgi:hypothetical protein